MKYKIIASVIILVIVIAALALKGCASAGAVDENGNPIATETQPQ